MSKDNRGCIWRLEISQEMDLLKLGCKNEEIRIRKNYHHKRSENLYW